MPSPSIRPYHDPEPGPPAAGSPAAPKSRPGRKTPENPTRVKARLNVHNTGTTQVRLDKQLLAEVDKKLGGKIKGGRPEILRYVLQCYWYVARVLDVCSHGAFAGRTTRGWGDLPAAAVKDPAMLEQEMAKLNGNEDEANFTAFLELADVGANAVADCRHTVVSLAMLRQASTPNKENTAPAIKMATTVRKATLGAAASLRKPEKPIPVQVPRLATSRVVQLAVLTQQLCAGSASRIHCH